MLERSRYKKQTNLRRRRTEAAKIKNKKKTQRKEPKQILIEITIIINIIEKRQTKTTNVKVMLFYFLHNILLSMWCEKHTQPDRKVWILRDGVERTKKNEE